MKKLIGAALVFAVLPYELQLALIGLVRFFGAAVVDNRYAVTICLLGLVLGCAAWIWRAGYVHGIDVVWREGQQRNDADRKRRLG